jgi:type II secretory pathway pseudopilin PulG
MKNQDYKIKYADLKLKFHDAVDVAFRLGFEQGAQSAQMQQAQQQAQDAQMQQQQMAQMQAQGGQPGQDPNAPPGQDTNNPGSPDGSGSEMDQHINTLESMVSKQDPGSPEVAGMMKTLNEMRSLIEMKKSENAISAIAKAMKPKFTIGKGANKNLS